RNHCRVLNALDGVQFVGVFDPAENLPTQIERQPVIHDLDRFLDLELAYCEVAVPTIYHLQVGRNLAERGIHALIEKPVASDPDSSYELVRLFKEAGLVGGVGHIERYNPALQSMRERLEAGMLGDIYQIATRRQGPFPGRIAD